MKYVEKEKRCLEFIKGKLEKKLGKLIVGKVNEDIFDFINWKGWVNVNDVKIYDFLAKSLEIKNLKKDKDGLYYTIKLPKNNEVNGDLWYVNLEDNYVDYFLEEYGQSYKVVSLI